MKQESVVLARPPHIELSAGTRPDFSELLRRATGVSAVVRERAKQTERDRRVSAEVTALLQQEGLYRALQPRRFGGYEFSHEELRQLAFVVGQGCASTGWCYGLGAANSWIVGMFPGEAQHDVWGQDSSTLVAACIAPTGRATRVDGGFRLKGRWGFASNCDNSTWMALGAMTDDGDGKPPRPIFLLVPIGDYDLIDTWHTVGLAGTGSKDIGIESEVFVPAHRTVTFSEVLEQQGPGALVNDGALFRIPFLSGFPALLANPAVSALRGRSMSSSRTSEPARHAVPSSAAGRRWPSSATFRPRWRKRRPPSTRPS